MAKDYFLGNREISEAEKLVVPLRLTHLVKRLHDGSKLYKDPPGDIMSLPTFKIIKNLNGLNKNPLLWNVDETFTFVKFIAASKTVAKLLRAEEINGEALVNLTFSDLTNNLHLDAITAESLMKTFTQLRAEIIERFVNV